MPENLEELKPGEEVVTPTPKEEEKPTLPEVKPTLEKTYTQKELDKAVGKGVSSIQSQLTLSQTEAERAREAHDQLQQELQALKEAHEKLVEKQFADEPEAFEGYKKTKAIEAKEKEIARREAEVERNRIEAESLRWAINMKTKADELRQQYVVPVEVLEFCTTEEQMEKIAKSFPTRESVEEEKKEPAPKFDSGVSTGSGGKISLDAQRKMGDKDWFEAKEGGRIP